MRSREQKDAFYSLFWKKYHKRVKLSKEQFCGMMEKAEVKKQFLK